MLKEKLIGVLVFAYTFFCNCHTEPARSAFKKEKKGYRVEGYARMPEELQESSGLTGAAGGTFWVLQDGGNPAALHRIAANGKLIESLQLNLPNYDWESLTRDAEGNLYIGDFGNNRNNRRNLRIFRLNKKNQQVDTIAFYYPEQEFFPPAEKGEKNYDAEAFFWHQGKLHLFSKSYGDKVVRHYTLPDSSGSYAARLEGTRKLHGLVTGAAISPDGKELALLSYGKLYLFDVTNRNDFLEKPKACVNLVGRAQTEAVVYLNNSNLLITNEQRRLIYVRKEKSSRCKENSVYAPSDKILFSKLT